MDEEKGKITFCCVTSQRGSAVVKQSTLNLECRGSDPATSDTGDGETFLMDEDVGKLF